MTSMLPRYPHRFAFDLALVDACVRCAPLHAMNRLEPKSDRREILKELAIAPARRALTQPRQQIAVYLNRGRGHAPKATSVQAKQGRDWTQS